MDLITVSMRNTMTAMRCTALATMVWALWLLPGAAQAEVYKCSVGGRAIYQDQPCADSTEAGPYKAGAARSNLAPPSSDPATLQKQLKDAREHTARLRSLYDQDVQQAKAKAMSLDQQRQRTKVLHARWDPKLQEAGRREQELSEALRRICPACGK